AICYITDNEMFPIGSGFYCEEYVERLADFVRAADVLITGCTYPDGGYPRKGRWGHSSVSEVADLAARARTKSLDLFPPDPDDSDAVIDGKLALLRERLGADSNVVAPTQLAAFEL